MRPKLIPMRTWRFERGRRNAVHAYALNEGSIRREMILCSFSFSRMAAPAGRPLCSPCIDR